MKLGGKAKQKWIKIRWIWICNIYQYVITGASLFLQNKIIFSQTIIMPSLCIQVRKKSCQNAGSSNWNSMAARREDREGEAKSSKKE
jgi:hypothetical protein